MKGFLVIEQDLVIPIEYNSNTELFDMKVALQEQFKTFHDNQKKFIADCMDETRRYNAILTTPKEKVKPDEMVLKFPTHPNGNKLYVEFQGNKIWYHTFINYNDGSLKRNLDITLIEEEKFWETYKTLKNKDRRNRD